MKIYTCIFVLMVFAFAKAQKEDAIWYFGNNAGIDFNSGTAVAIGDGQLITLEGCSTISDSQGNLLFYTDGSTVYNRTHVIMPNGTGLKGNSSSTSSSILVPDPVNLDQYYIITVDTDDSTYRASEGLHYSIVDLTQDNGLGDVLPLSKNTQLLSLTSEKLTAVSNANEDGYWVITHFLDTFYAYEITASGLNSTPVTSVVPPFIELVNVPFTNVDVSALRGYIKVNKTGDLLVAAHFSNTSTADYANIINVQEARVLSYVTAGELYLYDFDNATGQVSNPVPLMDPIEGGSFYGVEFSPSGRYLYAEIDYLSPGPNNTINYGQGEIAQFDLLTATVPPIKNTVHVDTENQFRGALQLGLDNKIYHSRLDRTQLSVIESPDLQGTAANYQLNRFALSANARSQYGLPIFVQSIFTEATIIGEDHCLNTEQQFSINVNGTVLNAQWNFGDPNSGANNTSASINPSHVFSSIGVFTVRVDFNTATQAFTIEKDIEVLANPILANNIEDIVLCDEGFNVATFDLSEIPMQASSNPNQVVSIHQTFSDAERNINEIPASMTYQNRSSPEVLFVRVALGNCYLITSFTLYIKNCPPKVPGLFTPNNDGINDKFTILGLRNVYESFKLLIFTRYGRKIYEGDNNTDDWDGKAQKGLIIGNDFLPAGTYYYVLELNDTDTPQLSGYVYLNR